jgi:hypothetical protein
VSLLIGLATVREPIEDIVRGQLVQPSGFDSQVVRPPRVQSQPFPTGWDSLRFGLETTVGVQGCSPFWGHSDTLFGFGIPIVVFTQTITEVNRNDEGGSQLAFPKQRINPCTIWAQLNPPDQARVNHPGQPFHELGTFDNPPEYGLPPWFGHAAVSTPHTQTAAPHHKGDGNGNDYTRGEMFGTTTQVESTKRFVYPPGIDARRFGFPTLPHPAKVWNFGWLDGVMDGVVTVGIRPLSTQWLYPVGTQTASIGGPRVENWVRNIYPSGFSATLYGNNFPMVYHSPRGPRPGNIDFTEFGEDTWVSHAPRDCPIEGFESFDEGYTVGQFNERMRITKGAAPNTMSVGNVLRVGIPDVSRGGGATQYIGAYMIPPPQYCHPHAIEEN